VPFMEVDRLARVYYGQLPPPSRVYEKDCPLKTLTSITQ
jgi:hypothetical protein